MGEEASKSVVTMLAHKYPHSVGRYILPPFSVPCPCKQAVQPGLLGEEEQQQQQQQVAGAGDAKLLSLDSDSIQLSIIPN
jgi:hypothetical protein